MMTQRLLLQHDALRGGGTHSLSLLRSAMSEAEYAHLTANLAPSRWAVIGALFTPWRLRSVLRAKSKASVGGLSFEHGKHRAKLTRTFALSYGQEVVHDTAVETVTVTLQDDAPRADGDSGQ